MTNAHLEKWSTAGGRGGGAIPSWEITGYTGAMTEPTYMPLIATPSLERRTNGMVTGEAIEASITTPADLEKWKQAEGQNRLDGALAGTRVPDDASRPSLYRRRTARHVPEVLPRAEQAAVARTWRRQRGTVRHDSGRTPAFTEKQRMFFADEGVLLTVTANSRGQSGTVFASNGSPRTGDPRRIFPRSPSPPKITTHHSPVGPQGPVKLSFRY